MKMKLSNKTLKVIGMGATVIGFGLTLIQNMVDDNKRAEVVKDEVAKQLKELSKED